MAQHNRKFTNPEPVNDYGEYRELLREDFEYSCAYCNISETELQNLRLFHIDHYKPKGNKHFPSFAALRNDYTNLLYSCYDCNGHKGEYWPNSLKKIFKAFEYVINPCLEDPDEHLDKTSHDWQHKSQTGKWNIKRLHLRNLLKIKCREKRLKWSEDFAKAKVRKQQAQLLLAEAVQSGNNLARDHFLDSIELANEAIVECNRFLGKKLD